MRNQQIKTLEQTAAQVRPNVVGTDEIVARIARHYQQTLDLDTPPEVKTVSLTRRPYSVIRQVTLVLNTENVRLYVKAVDDSHPELVEKEYTILSRLFRKLRNHHGCSVIEPVVYFPEIRTLVTVEASGDTLGTLIKRQTRRYSSAGDFSALETACGNTGSWLKTFQSLTEVADCEQYALSDTIAHVHRQLDKTYRAGLIGKRMKDELLELVRYQGAAVIEERIPVSWTHADFIPSNVVANEEGIIVLDFQSLKQEPVFRDVLTFVCALDSMLAIPVYRPDFMLKLQKQFINGWAQKVPADQMPLVFLFVLRETLGELLRLKDMVRNGLPARIIAWRLQQYLNRRLHKLIEENFIVLQGDILTIV